MGLYKPLVRKNKHAGKFAYQLENSIFFVFIGFLKYWFSAKYKRNSNYFSKPLIFLRLVRRKVWSYAKKAVTSCKNTTKDCKVFDNIVKRLYTPLQPPKEHNQLVPNILQSLARYMSFKRKQIKTALWKVFGTSWWKTNYKE